MIEQLNNQQCVTLNDGNLMPKIGLGTYGLRGEEGVTAFKSALTLGYRHIDTATLYENHEAIAEAIKGTRRDKLFITSKINSHDLSLATVSEVFEKILTELSTPYIDLLLIHDPKVPKIETLEKLHGLKHAGKIKSVGVSNYTIKNLEEIRDAGFIVAVNQVEFHPYLNQRALLGYCREYNIVLTSYRSFCLGKILDDPTLSEIAGSHQKSNCQITLMWLLQKGLTVIPKAENSAHQQENINIFNDLLSENEMKLIDNLNRSLRTNTGPWDEFED